MEEVKKLEEVVVVEEEKPQKTKLKITKKKTKKVVEEKVEPEKTETGIKFQLKKVTKKKVNQAKEVVERVPVEEVTEFIPEVPSEVIQFIDTEEEPKMEGVKPEGVCLCGAWLPPRLMAEQQII